MPRSHLSLPLAAAVLLACQPSKDTETTAASTGPEDGTFGHSSTPQSGTATTGVGTGVTTSTDSPPDPTADTVPTTDPTGLPSGTSSTTVFPGETDATTTGVPGCVPDPPPPKMCNKAVGGGDGQAFGASTGGCGEFICPVDVGGGLECDIFEQDCPEGQKCNAWSSDGDNSWDSTKCVPIDPNPDPVFAPCTVEGFGASGVDSCVKGAMCFGVDEETLQGTCVELCTCSPENPICNLTPATCLIANDGVLALCLPSCDPLNPNACPGDQVCISNPQDPAVFICITDASGGEGQVFDPCEFANACDPTLLCANPALLPGCNQDAAGCCVPFCDLSAIDCPPGADCLPWFEEGQAPKCFEDIGVCGVQ